MFARSFPATIPASSFHMPIDALCGYQCMLDAPASLAGDFARIYREFTPDHCRTFLFSAGWFASLPFLLFHAVPCVPEFVAEDFAQLHVISFYSLLLVLLSPPTFLRCRHHVDTAASWYPPRIPSTADLSPSYPQARLPTVALQPCSAPLCTPLCLRRLNHRVCTSFSSFPRLFRSHVLAPVHSHSAGLS